ncbi:hypothetical protein [Sinimarinibacterium sp. NLF-5-8]|uniref:hypothetical protein n=1 Tax=Sinimarinibacterium sp. NLF-5-8 TaxID=2698684 RepID=UPI00137BFA3F|nr:hypothetical protein [Sinimarinibacterium sp. NLF-5-8]QHS09112.1 hypothetical protein GT972_02390 [Sinimarinibacterium sp. NLF-5-8]
MTRLPTHSLWTLSTPEQRLIAARWAVADVRLPGHLVDEGIQEIMFAFTRHRASPQTSERDLGRLMRTTAKRWAIDIKRKLAYPVRLNPDDFWNPDARGAAEEADIDFDPAILQQSEADDGAEQVQDGFEHCIDPQSEQADYRQLPASAVYAIEQVWDQLKPAQQDFFSHMLAGHSVHRAGELEKVSLVTARAYHKIIAAKLEEALACLSYPQGNPPLKT